MCMSAYICDFAMRLSIMGESFETSISWSRCEAMVQAVCDSDVTGGVKRKSTHARAKR